MTLFEDLRAACAEEWHDYTHHAFVEQLGDGTLPLPAFQDYLMQDYIFLIHFARANALAAYKSRTLEEIKGAADALTAILRETDLHVALTREWGIPTEDLLRAPEKQGTVAYTRFVLDSGQLGDLLELSVALAPCAIGYAEIGTRLAPLRAARPDHPYAQWIDEYSGEDFQQAARDAITRLDQLAERMLTPARREELIEVFRTATRMETAFWQQALEIPA